MDYLLVQEIDQLLKQRLPNKSSLSGADYIPVYPDNTGQQSLNSSNTYRFRLPKMGNMFLARSKGATGAYFTYNLSGYVNGVDNTFRGETWLPFQQMRILINGVEVHNNLYYNHTYAEWIKMKRRDWLLSDGGNLGINYTYNNGFDATTVCTNGTYSSQFYTPIPDNYSILNNKNFAVPLENLDILVEMTLNNYNNILCRGGAANALDNAIISNLVLYIPVVKVDPEVSDAINMRLMDADMDEEKMLLFPVEDVKTDKQSATNLTAPGTQSFVFTNVNASVRLLQAKLSTDPANAAGVATAYQTMTGINPNMQSYQFIADGKNVLQNPTVSAQLGPYDQCYALSNDLKNTFNVINNEDDCSGNISKSIFNGPNYTGSGNYPAYNASLNQSFDMVANLDTVSRDLVGGKKIINNLTLNIRYSGLAGLANVGLYLIQYSNRIIAVSKNKCRVLK